MVVNSIIGSLLVYAFLGLSPEAGAVYTLCTALGEFFYHTSVTTPRWVGWFFQCSEMHRIHHQHGRHKATAMSTRNPELSDSGHPAFFLCQREDGMRIGPP